METEHSSSSCLSSCSTESLGDRTTTLRYTLWTKKQLDARAIDIYKSVILAIEPTHHNLMEALDICLEKPNTLNGSIEFDDDHWKEWCVIKILLKMTIYDDSLVVHLIDDFGCPLALELCDKLKLNNKPDKRLYLHKGGIHLVPAIVKLDSLKAIYSKTNIQHYSERDAAANFIRDVNLHKECCDSRIFVDVDRSNINVNTTQPRLSKAIDDLNGLQLNDDISEQEQILEQIPDVPTDINPIVQKHILDILDGLRDYDTWNRTFTERQSRRLMSLNSGKEHSKVCLDVDSLMNIAIENFDTSPFSSNESSSRTSKDTSSQSSISDIDDSSEASEDMMQNDDKPVCSHDDA